MRNSEENMNFVLLCRILMCIWTVNPILVDSRPVPIDLRQWQEDYTNGVASSNPQQDDSVWDQPYAHERRRDAQDKLSTHEVGAPEDRIRSSNTVQQRRRKNNRGSMKQLKDGFNAQESVGAVKDWNNVPNADSRAPLMNKKHKMASRGQKKKGPSIKSANNRLEVRESNNRQQQRNVEEIQQGSKDTADGTKSDVPNHGRFSSAARNFNPPKYSEKSRSQNYYQRPVTNDVYISQPSLQADYSHTGKQVQRSAGEQSSLDVKRSKHPSSRSDFSNVDVYLRRALDKINVGRNRRDPHVPASGYINSVNLIEQEPHHDNTMAAKAISSLNRQAGTTRFAPGSSPRKTRDFLRNNAEFDDDNTVAAKDINVPDRRSRNPRYTPGSPPEPTRRLFNPEIGNSWLKTFSNLIGAASGGGKVET